MFSRSNSKVLESKGSSKSKKVKKSTLKKGKSSSPDLLPQDSQGPSSSKSTKLDSSVFSSASSDIVGVSGKGKGKSKGKQRLLRPRKSQSSPTNIDNLPLLPSSSTESIGDSIDLVVKGKGKKRSLSEKQEPSLVPDPFPVQDKGQFQK